MLQAIRTRAGSIVVKILFGLLIISFGFWGIFTRSDYYQGHSPDTVIATVGDANIRADDLQRVLQPTMERLRAQLGRISELASEFLAQKAGLAMIEESNETSRQEVYELLG